MEHHKYKSKEQIQSEEMARLQEEKARKANEKKISTPSPHILVPTAAIENAKYVKEKVEVNPKELGWKSHPGQREYFGSALFDDMPRNEGSFSIKHLTSLLTNLFLT